MSDFFIGEVKMFAGNFAPAGWTFCAGQIMAISQNTALFSILGTTYGGDGINTFALPDLRGRIPTSQGQAPGLSSYALGEQIGVEAVSLTANQLPSHGHLANANPVGSVVSPHNAVWSTDPAGNTAAYNNDKTTTMSPTAIAGSGSGSPHDNMPPFLGINFIIALLGTFPARN